MANTRHTSVQMSCVCSTTATSAGVSYTPNRAGSTTSHWSKREAREAEGVVGEVVPPTGTRLAHPPSNDGTESYNGSCKF